LTIQQFDNFLNSNLNSRLKVKPHPWQLN